MRTRRLVLAVLAALAFVTGASAAPPKDAIVIGLLAEPVTMDPPQITDLNSARVTKRIFEGLVAQELGSYKLVPGLARSWEISKDGLIYTFNLRANVTFHDGTPFNAEAVKFCFERQLNEQGPYYKTGTYPYVKGFLGNVQGVEVVNHLTVQIKLKAPLTPFLQYLAHQSLFVYSPEALKKWGKDIVKHPVGTGPFKLETWEPGVKVVLARNDQYWGGAPKIRQAIYVPIIEAQARLAAIKTEAIIRDILKGTAIVSSGPLSPVYGPFHEEKFTRYPYAPEKAKALLKDAGYAGGFEVVFLVPESGSGMQQPVEMGTVIQAQLQAVGIKAKIQTMEWGAYLKKYLDAPDMAEMSWNPSIGDPDHVTYMLLSSDRFPPAFNAGFYQNARVDELLRKGRTTVGDGERAAIYKEAQRIISDEAPWIFIDHGRQIIIHRKRVQGFKLHPNFDLVLTQVWLQ